MPGLFRARLTTPIAVLLSFAICVAANFGAAEDEIPAAPTETPPLLIGMAKVDITPDLNEMPVSLNGYGGRARAKATGVRDPIFVRALVAIDPHGSQIAVVSTDLCYVTTIVHDEALSKLAVDGFDDHNFLLTATHNHSGFAGYDRSFIAKVAMGAFDEKILKYLTDSIAEAVREARASAEPARIEMASKDVFGLNRSRLDPGFVHGNESANTAPDTGAHPVNRTLTVLKFSRTDGSTIGALVHFTAHPTVLSPKSTRVSADYPGVVYRRVEEALGPETTVLYMNGPLGDAAPSPDWVEGVSEDRQMEDYGEALSKAILDVMASRRAFTANDVAGSAVREPFERVVVRSWGRSELPHFLSRAFYVDPEVTFQTTRLGSLVVIAVPGEATYATGEMYQTMCPPGARCIVTGPANAYMGYLVTREQYEVDGYES
ncbi:MAG: neutral/alkaline non-lysosomal ceramidase N-terminal domain-containing protein, partial [Deltaproteobacteria bacterium]|nr:neutral/alkaline non-lysosomal ceramidase N-terminal domain-containing protein [Deltaproteobacteria bacterium]